MLWSKAYSLVAHTSCSPLPNNGAMSLLQAQTFSWVPSLVAFQSPALSSLQPFTPGAPLPHLLCCLHTTNPSLLPGTHLQSLGLGTQSPPKRLSLWDLCQRFWWSVWLSHCLSVLWPADALFVASWRSLGLSWSFRRFGEFPGCGFPFSFTIPSQESSPDAPSLSLLFSVALCSCVKRFFPFLEVSVLLPAFSCCSVWVILHVDVYFLLHLWERWTNPPTLSPSGISKIVSFFIFLYGLCLFQSLFFLLCVSQLLLSCLDHWNMMSHSLTFSLYVFFALKGVSCRQQVVCFCFLIQSAALCLLIRVFSPLTLKVIIEKHVFIPMLNLAFQLIRSITLFFFFSLFFWWFPFILCLDTFRFSFHECNVWFDLWFPCFSSRLTTSYICLL